MATANQNKKQHFLPQSYLRNFSDNGKYIWTYSKRLQKSYFQSISNAAQQKGFYKIDEKFLKNDPDKTHSNFIETDFFAKNIEKGYASTLTLINTSVEEWLENSTSKEVLPKVESELFAAQIGIQYLRLPHVRNNYWDFYKKSSAARLEIIKGFVGADYPSEEEFLKSITFQADEAGKSILHSTIFGDQQIVDGFQDAILDKYWVFHVATEGGVFTSDAPIIPIRRLPMQQEFLEGFRMRGVEIVFPLGSRVILSLYDKEHFPDKAAIHNQFHALTAKNLREYNVYQYVGVEEYNERRPHEALNNMTPAEWAQRNNYMEIC